MWTQLKTFSFRVSIQSRPQSLRASKSRSAGSKSLVLTKRNAASGNEIGFNWVSKLICACVCFDFCLLRFTMPLLCTQRTKSKAKPTMVCTHAFSRNLYFFEFWLVHSEINWHSNCPVTIRVLKIIIMHHVNFISAHPTPDIIGGIFPAVGYHSTPGNLTVSRFWTCTIVASLRW